MKAVVVNRIPRVLNSEPGLVAMEDLSVPGDGLLEFRTSSGSDVGVARFPNAGR